MTIELKIYDKSLLPQFLLLQNIIIEEGVAFPWYDLMTLEEFGDFYKPEEPVWCAVDGDKLLGFTHIHPNGTGRTGHIANCGYGIMPNERGKGIGKMLVAKSIEVAREMGFKGIQFNCVVETNTAAVELYKSFGFKIIGTIPGGFLIGSKDDPSFVGRHIMFLEL